MSKHLTEAEKRLRLFGNQVNNPGNVDPGVAGLYVAVATEVRAALVHIQNAKRLMNTIANRR